jgi:MFS family permease
MFGMDNTGKLAGPVLGGYIASEWSATGPFFAYSGIALVALALTLAFGEKPTGDDHGARRERQAQANKLTIWRIVTPRLVYFGVALFAGLTRGPVTADLLHLYAAYAYQLGPTQIGYLATGAALIAWPIGFIAGWILDRFGRKRTMVPGFTGVAISMALLAASAWWGYSYPWYVALFFLAVATQSLTGGSVQTIGTDVAPQEARGVFLGIWRFSGQGGQAIGPIIFAMLAAQVNYSVAFLFTAGCAACVATLLILMVPETRSDWS